MRDKEKDFYRCPLCKSHLMLKSTLRVDDDILEGSLYDDNGHNFLISDGIPNFIDVSMLSGPDMDSKKEYDDKFDTYDSGINFFFKTLGIDEYQLRQSLADFLQIKIADKVLEVGCGTGRDSEIIVSKLDENGKIYLQDLSLPMLKLCRSKLSSKSNAEYSTANGSSLPFENGVFDVTFHFGGINTFTDIKGAFNEMTRVTRIGGTVVVGDESLAPWLRNTSFGKMLTNANRLFENSPPLEHIPANARDVDIKWMANGTFYLIKYIVGEGLPYLDTDIEFPGQRGGTYRTRYYGNLEGVTEETKDYALRAIKKSGKSIHKWLDEVIRDEALKELKQDV